MKKYVLITGVAGLIGSKFAKWILDNTEYGVAGVDNFSGGYLENIDNRIQIHFIDVESDLNYIFEKYEIEYVFHFAAYAAEGMSPFIRTFNYTNNLIATTNIVNCCLNHNVKRLIFTSSMAVYGVQETPYFETQIPCPIDPYGVAKYACELDIKCAGEHQGLDWCIIRPHNVYGPNQNIWDKYRNVLGIWMRQLLSNQPLTIFGDGTQIRAFSFIDDCLSTFWHAAISPRASKTIFNLGSDDKITIVDAAKKLIDVVGFGILEHHEPRHEVSVAFSDHSKVKNTLGFYEQTRLEDGLLQMWNWAKDQSPKKIKIWENLETEKNFVKLWKKK